MPPVVDATRFIELIAKSKLVPEPILDQAIERLRTEHDGQIPTDLDQLQDFFVEQDLLTDWHCEKLRIGKYKGFFLSKYRLLKHLGTGGMSSVYLGEHTLMNRKVAIKVLPRRRVHDASYLARFHLEAEAAARLDHPNIVRAFDVDNENDTHYIVMEFVPGSDLQQVVRERGPVPVEAAADYIAQAADGLQHAHDKGIVHRDIKPANLLLDDRGLVKILDMGLARLKREEESSIPITPEENVLGTADYLSPEQAENSETVDHRADIYSLGCSLYFLLAGHPPFPDGSMAQRIAMHKEVMPAKIRRSRPNCPETLEQICEMMMAKNPDQRYDQASDIAAELRRWLESRGKEPTHVEEMVDVGMLSLASQTVKATHRDQGQHLAERDGRNHSDGGGEGSRPRRSELRDSPSSSTFDPATSDTIANRDNDTTPHARPATSPRGPRADRKPSSSSLFDSHEFAEARLDMEQDAAAMEEFLSNPVSAASPLSQSELPTPQQNVPRLSSSAEGSTSSNPMRRVPVWIWGIVVATCALGVGLLWLAW
ncbi:serine/threonine-protein kinase [Blastopirellula marina]|uniref:non-specific serine/threonine protein kinase n=1 Tax=Blastopirellula marina TaxID=124 RepID=A0A2S8GTR6_9BACT|nr:serine/threonine-protein kinase [Blastopirellula marina]PQO47800.1 serine/threonine protein kinase [Blastopirellula marina]